MYMRGLLLNLCFVLLFAINIYGQSGQDGNVSWSVSGHTLTLTGTGMMNDYDFNNNKAPWYDHRAIIKNVVIKDGFTTIGNSAFALCSEIEGIEIPNGITSIGDNAFLACRKLTDIDSPNNLKVIGALAFGACSGLSGIIIPGEVDAIGEGAFSGCSGLKSINVNVDNKTFKDINGIVFSKDEKELLIYPAGKDESSYIIPNHVIKMGYGVFLNCENLTRIEIQDGVTSIGREAFYNCKNLRIIKISSSVTTIGDNAFHYCSSLDTIEVYWNNPIIVNSGIYTASSVAKATLSVPKGRKSAYEAANVWKDFYSIVERESVGNELVDKETIYVSVIKRVLVIESPYYEIVRVYNIVGTLVFSIEKSEGKITFPFSNLQNGIYIATGSSGWTTKFLIQQ